MVDRIQKALRKLSDQQRNELAMVIERILHGDFMGLDIKKLQGTDDVYRVRKGSLRIIFRKTPTETRILAIERRSETTYREF